MTFVYPEALVLSILATVFWWWITSLRGPETWREGLRRRATTVTNLCSLLLLLGLVILAAAPQRAAKASGADVVILVDRSLSMPPGSLETAAEVIRLVEDQRLGDSRVAVVSFGARAGVESAPSSLRRFSTFAKDVGTDGSDLSAGLDLALGLIPSDRRGRILVLSDGVVTGPDPRLAGTRAASLGISIDHRVLERSRAEDVAVESLDLPTSVQLGEAFQIGATVVSDAPRTVRYALERSGEILSEGSMELAAGRQRWFFRDRLAHRGLTEYVLELSDVGDAIPENDRGRAVVHVEGHGGILIVNPDGVPTNLARALLAAKREVRVVAAPELRIDLDSLDAFSVIVLENVAAGDFEHRELEVLARFVENVGGGLLITGGRRSFGVGGYHRSPLDPVLPVTMELRREHRKLRMALATVLDRSGSMSAAVPNGATKMDLANQGVAEAVRLLSGPDEIAIIAVDTGPDIVQPLVAVGNQQSLIATRALGITCGNGGIFTFTGLRAAKEVLQASDAETRHIVLFADASDAEEQEGCPELIAELTSVGMTVSVVAMGSEKDVHAAFLKDVAARGQGQIYFAEDPEELPRLFSQDTIAMARSAFVEAKTASQIQSDVVQMADLTALTFPTVDGYNLTYARPEATVGVVTRDEYAAPMMAFWQCGLGRVVAFCSDVDGRHSGELAGWSEYDRFFATISGWLVGDDAGRSMAGVLRREGHTVTVKLELDPEARESWPREVPRLVATPRDPALPVLVVPFTFRSETELEASYALGTGDTHHHRVGVDGRQLRLPSVTLPYSPEHEPRLGRPAGRATVAELAARSGGRERLVLDGVFDVPSPVRRPEPLGPWIAGLLLALAVFDIAWRRLGLGRPAGLRARTQRRASRGSETTLAAPSVGRIEVSTQTEKLRADPLESLDRARERVERRLRRRR